MRIFPSAPCVTRSSLETESATRVNTLAAKGCSIPIRWAFISAISSGASPTHYKKNGHRYYGEFKDGEYSGRGIQFWKSGAVCVGDFKNGHCFGTDTIWYKKSIYVGVCVKGKPNGDGILYIHKASGRKYYFMEGLFVDGKFASGLYSNSYGVFSTAGGNFTADYRKGNSDIEIYSQLELRYRYEFLKTLKPKKFPGANLTEEQRLFLDGKLSSEQILSIRKSQ